MRQRDGAVTIQPGNYGDIKLRSNATLFFAGGTYNVKSIRGAPRSRFVFSAPTTINVAEVARFGFRSFIGPQFPEELNGRCVVINVAGSKVRFRPWADVTATVTAPPSDVGLGGFRLPVLPEGMRQPRAERFDTWHPRPGHIPEGSRRPHEPSRSSA